MNWEGSMLKALEMLVVAGVNEAVGTIGVLMIIYGLIECARLLLHEQGGGYRTKGRLFLGMF